MDLDEAADESWEAPEWHWEVLERRIAAADADPGGFEPYETALNRLAIKAHVECDDVGRTP